MTRIGKGLLSSGEVSLGSLLPISYDNDQKQGNLAAIVTQNWQAYSMNGCVLFRFVLFFVCCFSFLFFFFLVFLLFVLFFTVFFFFSAKDPFH